MIEKIACILLANFPASPCNKTPLTDTKFLSAETALDIARQIYRAVEPRWDRTIVANFLKDLDSIPAVSPIFGYDMEYYLKQADVLKGLLEEKD